MVFFSCVKQRNIDLPCLVVERKKKTVKVFLSDRISNHLYLKLVKRHQEDTLEAKSENNLKTRI